MLKGMGRPIPIVIHSCSYVLSNDASCNEVNQQGIVRTFQTYSTSTRKWKLCQPLPDYISKTSGARPITVDDYMLIISGCEEHAKYTPTTDTWWDLTNTRFYHALQL